MDIRIKRIYDLPDAADGTRILVDRLWPRGVSKNRAHLDDWLKDTAPAKQPAIEQVRRATQNGPVTLLYAAKSPTINHAVVLRDYLLEKAAT